MEASPIVAFGYVYGLRLRSIVFGPILRLYTRFYGFLRLYSNYSVSTSRLLYVSTSLRLFSSSSHRLWTTLRLHTRSTDFYVYTRIISSTSIRLYDSTFLRLFLSLRTSTSISASRKSTSIHLDLYVYNHRKCLIRCRMTPGNVSNVERRRQRRG